ncbi:hypothetical protein ALT717_30140 [Alteromonas macleodii]
MIEKGKKHYNLYVYQTCRILAFYLSRSEVNTRLVQDNPLP